MMLLGAITVAVTLTRCGSVISGIYNESGNDFDFRHPPCSVGSVSSPSDLVEVCYLGAGGVYVAWHGHALLLGPFFSNPSFLRAQFGRMTSDDALIARQAFHT